MSELHIKFCVALMCVWLFGPEGKPVAKRADRLIKTQNSHCIKAQHGLMSFSPLSIPYFIWIVLSILFHHWDSNVWSGHVSPELPCVGLCAVDYGWNLRDLVSVLPSEPPSQTCLRNQSLHREKKILQNIVLVFTFTVWEF